MSGSVTVVFNKLPAIAAALPKVAEAVIEKGAHDIEAGAKTRAPVDTGNLRNSITAEQLTALAWMVYVGAYYGIYQEMGTYKMAAHPFLIPAFEAVRDSIVEAMHAALKGLA